MHDYKIYDIMDECLFIIQLLCYLLKKLMVKKYFIPSDMSTNAFPAAFNKCQDCISKSEVLRKRIHSYTVYIYIC